MQFKLMDSKREKFTESTRMKKSKLNKLNDSEH